MSRSPYDPILKAYDRRINLLVLGALAACGGPDPAAGGTPPLDAGFRTDSGRADTGLVLDLGVQMDGGPELDATPTDVEPAQDVESWDVDATAADVVLTADAEPTTDAAPPDTGGYGPVTVILRQNGQPVVDQAFFNDQNGPSPRSPGSPTTRLTAHL